MGVKTQIVLANVLMVIVAAVLQAGDVKLLPDNVVTLIVAIVNAFIAFFNGAKDMLAKK